MSNKGSRMNRSKISTSLYKWIKVLHDKNVYKSPCLDKIKSLLDGIGMYNVFNNITSVNKAWFKSTIKQKTQ